MRTCLLRHASATSSHVVIPEVPAEQLQCVVEEVAGQLLGDGQIDAPPVDAFQLAERLGLVVARDGWGATRGRFLRISGDGCPAQPTILLADDPRAERRHWALAHEIGESVAWRVFDALGIDPCEAPAAAREHAANRLAGCLLLPRCWLMSAGEACDWDLFELKRAFDTASHELVARRMLEMPPPVIVTLFDQGRTVWRRSNALPRAPRVTAVERMTWSTAHESDVPAAAEPELLPDGIENVRAWPVHEPGWRREILRTDLMLWH